MLNFELYNPTNYVFGKGQIQKISTLIPAGAKVLLAYGGGSIFRNGIYNQVNEALATFEVVEFGGIEPNPRFETKKEKLAQYAERVWHVTERTVETKALLAIEKTIDFFHTMGMQTKLSAYTTNYENTAQIIVARFEQRGWLALGERQNITLDKVKQIVEKSY